MSWSEKSWATLARGLGQAQASSSILLKEKKRKKTAHWCLLKGSLYLNRQQCVLFKKNQDGLDKLRANLDFLAELLLDSAQAKKSPSSKSPSQARVLIFGSWAGSTRLDLLPSLCKDDNGTSRLSPFTHKLGLCSLLEGRARLALSSCARKLAVKIYKI